MKKLIFCLTAAFIFAACEGPMGPVGPQGPQGVPGQNGYDGQDGEDGRDGQDGEGAKWYSTKITVFPHEWVLTNGKPGDLDTFFFVSKPLPRLTQYIYDYGSMVAYIENVDGVKNGMPFVWHRGEVSQDGKTEFLWTETYDFDFTVGVDGGEIGFYVRYSDFSTNIRPGEAKTFHVVMFWQ